MSCGKFFMGGILEEAAPDDNFFYNYSVTLLLWR